ncbi:MAG: hypothetical protein IT161_14070 [Bryobacterales bacterium]|nr:hypothetical protein [Bryobacterales bacterium]
MGFALWIQGDVAVAQGTHEYRPMGSAIISAQTRFTPRDFNRRRKGPSRFDPSFAGFFASLGQVNDYVEIRRSKKIRSQREKKILNLPLTSSIPPF